MFSVYLTVLEDKSDEEQFIDAYNTYKRLVYHTAYKVTGDPHLAEDVLQEVFLYVAKYSLQGTTQGRYLTGGVPPVRFSM